MQVNCHNVSANTFVVLVGDSQADFKYYGPPELYERYVGNARVVCYLVALPIMKVSWGALTAMACIIMIG